MHDLKKISEFEEIIKYRFKNKDLLLEALTHPSYIYLNDQVTTDYQRLEFLGDAILSFVLTDRLFKLYPDKKEGELARFRSVLIRGSGLANYARKINLSNFVLLSDSENKSGGNNKDSILEDVFEALVGAIYLDKNIVQVRKFIEAIFDDIEDVVTKALPNLNPKGQLQELLQPKFPELTIEYIVINSSGPDHRKFFEVGVSINGKILAKGEGNSKKVAEEQAAMQALAYLKTPTSII